MPVDYSVSATPFKKPRKPVAIRDVFARLAFLLKGMNMTDQASRISLYDAGQINDLVEQFNCANKQLADAITETRSNVSTLMMALKAALGPMKHGDELDNALALAQAFATLSQRVALLEAKSGSSAKAMRPMRVVRPVKK